MNKRFVDGAFASAVALLSLLPLLAAAENAKPPLNGTWAQEIVTRLRAARRYPLQASSQGGHARVIVHLDGTGHLISVALIESTGDALLDREALAMVERAQPFPPPPGLVVDDDGPTFVVPVFFAPRPLSTVLDFEEAKRNDALLRARLNGICRDC
ncbi:protein TonB [Bradyrhizobium sp. USDA 4369]